MIAALIRFIRQQRRFLRVCRTKPLPRGWDCAIRASMLSASSFSHGLK